MVWRIILAKIFPTASTKLKPGQLSHDWWFPFWEVERSLHPFSHPQLPLPPTLLFNSSILSHNSTPPYAQEEFRYFQPAFPFLSLLSAESNSFSVSGQSRSSLICCDVMPSTTSSRNSLGILLKCLCESDLTSTGLVVSSSSSYKTAVDLLGLHLASLCSPLSITAFFPSCTVFHIHSSFASSTASFAIDIYGTLCS